MNPTLQSSLGEYDGENDYQGYKNADEWTGNPQAELKRSNGFRNVCQFVAALCWG